MSTLEFLRMSAKESAGPRAGHVDAWVLFRTLRCGLGRTVQRWTIRGAASANSVS